MMIKKITNLLGIAAIGLMMGSSISYAVKGYGLLDASGDWARLIASNIVSSSSSSNNNKVDCSKYDLTKVTCMAKEGWKTEDIAVSTQGNGSGSGAWNGYSFSISGAGSGSSVTIVVTTPSCEKDDSNVCLKSHVTNNKPTFASSGGNLTVNRP